MWIFNSTLNVTLAILVILLAEYGTLSTKKTVQNVSICAPRYVYHATLDFSFHLHCNLEMQVEMSNSLYISFQLFFFLCYLYFIYCLSPALLYTINFEGAQHIYDGIICFRSCINKIIWTQVFKLYRFLSDPSEEMCQEKKALYKLISGLHSSISVHIAYDYLLDESANLVCAIIMPLS